MISIAMTVSMARSSTSTARDPNGHQCSTRSGHDLFGHVQPLRARDPSGHQGGARTRHNLFVRQFSGHAFIDLIFLNDGDCLLRVRQCDVCFITRSPQIDWISTMRTWTQSTRTYHGGSTLTRLWTLCSFQWKITQIRNRPARFLTPSPVLSTQGQ